MNPRSEIAIFKSIYTENFMLFQHEDFTSGVHLIFYILIFEPYNEMENSRGSEEIRSLRDEFSCPKNVNIFDIFSPL